MFFDINWIKLDKVIFEILEKVADMTIAPEHHFSHCRVRDFTLAVGHQLRCFFFLLLEVYNVIINTSIKVMTNKLFFF
jgi:hypothetical protein